MEIHSSKMLVKKAMYLKRGSDFMYLEHSSPCLDASAVLKSRKASFLSRTLLHL